MGKPDLFVAYDQINNESCVAAAICFAVFVVTQDSEMKGKIQSYMDRPSVNFAYHRMRQLDCSRGKKCVCKGGCSGVCDPKCGALLSIGFEVFEGGVPPTFVWPDDKPDNKALVAALQSKPFLGATWVYKISEYKTLPEHFLSALEVLQEGHPVVINIRVFPNQKPFFTHHSRSFHSSSPYDPILSLPAPQGDPMDFGHCMVMHGYSLDHQSFRVRNSFGSHWGFQGDFNLPFSQFDGHQIYQCVGVLSAHCVTV